MKQLLSILTLFLPFTYVSAQINILPKSQILPAFTSQSVYDFNIVNASGSNQYGDMVVTVSNNIEEIATYRVMTLLLNSGINTNWKLNSTTLPLEYSPTKSGQNFRANKIINLGNVTICIQFQPKSSEQVFRPSCIDINIEFPIALNLISPCDGCTIETTYPTLTWTSTLPSEFNKYYSLNICEVMENQSVFESQMRNTPVAKYNNLGFEHIVYEPTFTKLKYGSTYSWKVVLHSDALKSVESEIWTFKLGSGPERKVANQLRTPNPKRNQNPYIYENQIEFSYNNRFNMKGINIQIKNLDNPSKAVYKEYIVLESNANVVIIPFDQIKNMNSTNHYLLTFHDIRNQPYYLYFKMK